MNDLRTFKNMEFGELATLDINGKTYFPATDCAKVLGYTNPHKAIGDHCRYLTKRYLPHPQSIDKTIESHGKTILERRTHMNELKVIDQREVLGNKFRMYGTPEEPLFLAKDVATWIEHSNPTEMVRTIDEGEKLNSTILSAGQRREATFLTEDGLYEVLMQSRKPIAKQFKTEVKKILKTIRKTGSYNAEPQFNIPKTLPEALRLAAELADKNIGLNRENDLLMEKVLCWNNNAFTRAAVGKFAQGLKCDPKERFAYAWNTFKKELLYRHGININARVTSYLNRTGKKTRPKALDMLDDIEQGKAAATIVALCRESGTDISDLLKNLDNNDGLMLEAE